jgi:hypothetical protein
MTQKLQSIHFYDTKDKDSKLVQALLEKSKLPYHKIPNDGIGYPVSIETNNRIYSGVEEIRRYFSRTHGVD